MKKNYYFSDLFWENWNDKVRDYDESSPTKAFRQLMAKSGMNVEEIGIYYNKKFFMINYLNNEEILHVNEANDRLKVAKYLNGETYFVMMKMI